MKEVKISSYEISDLLGKKHKKIFAKLKTGLVAGGFDPEKLTFPGDDKELDLSFSQALVAMQGFTPEQVRLVIDEHIDTKRRLPILIARQNFYCAEVADGVSLLIDDEKLSRDDLVRSIDELLREQVPGMKGRISKRLEAEFAMVDGNTRGTKKPAGITPNGLSN